VLAACDAFVAPARYEAYGQAVHEALCCGLPALVSRSAGVAEHYPSELSELLLTDPDDVAELAARLQHCRDSLDRLRERVTAHAGTLRQQTWDKMSAQIVQAIESSRPHAESASIAAMSPAV